ncbi:MAG: hypothetical protein ACD_45C00088G0002 [uncultured bacterium]|nr:MAG: hypothetical protein ACD_45C00088G0002 [uncultured bacterium]
MKEDYIDRFLSLLSTKDDKRLALQEFCKQYYYFSIHQILAFSKMSLRYHQLDRKAICEIAKTIYEEYGSGKQERIHSVLFEKLMIACGVTKEDMLLAPDKVYSTTKAYIYALDNAFAAGTLAQALSAYVFLEKTAVNIYPRFLAALKTYNFSDDEIDFFIEHAYLEPKHLEAAYALVDQQYFSEADKQDFENQFLILEKRYNDFWQGLTATMI